MWSERIIVEIRRLPRLRRIDPCIGFPVPALNHMHMGCVAYTLTLHPTSCFRAQRIINPKMSVRPRRPAEQVGSTAKNQVRMRLPRMCMPRLMVARLSLAIKWEKGNEARC